MRCRAAPRRGARCRTATQRIGCERTFTIIHLGRLLLIFYNHTLTTQTPSFTVRLMSATGSAIAVGPRDALHQVKSWQLLHNSAKNSRWIKKCYLQCWHLNGHEAILSVARLLWVMLLVWETNVVVQVPKPKSEVAAKSYQRVAVIFSQLEPFVPLERYG